LMLVPKDDGAEGGHAEKFSLACDVWSGASVAVA
jgi:hypothetical protein